MEHREIPSHVIDRVGVKNNRPVCFVFPNRGIGGVSLMFLRLARYLKAQGIVVYLVDYIDGYMAINNDSHGIELIEYRDDEPCILPEASIALFQAMTPWSMYPSLEIPLNVKPFFITTVPTNLFPTLGPIFRKRMLRGRWFSQAIWNSFLRREYTKIREFLGVLSSTNSIAFLDTDVRDMSAYLFGSHLSSCDVVPLFSDQASLDWRAPSGYRIRPMRLHWLGRLGDFKTTILVRLMKDVLAYLNSHPDSAIEFTLITNSSADLRFFRKIRHARLEIEYLFDVNPNALKAILVRADGLFAMGTSCLEGAKYGVPSITLDYSYFDVPPSYRYRFLYESSGYSLGQSVDDRAFKGGKNTFLEVLELLENQPEEISQTTFEYYIKNHSINVSAERILRQISMSTLSWSELVNGFYMDSELYNVYSRLRAYRRRILN